MSEHPDDWYDDLLDREHHPDIDQPAGGIVGDLRDEALGHAKDYAKDKVKEVGKDAIKKAGKEAAKEGAKVGAQGAAEGATGAAAGSGAGAASGAAAAGGGIAATTGAETAGIGLLVGAAVAVGGALLSNKTFRKLLYVLVPVGLFMGIFILVSTVIMAPVIIMSAVVSAVGKPLEVVYDIRSTAIGVVTFGPKLAATGLEKGKDLADDAAGWVEDHSPVDIDIPGLGAATTPHDPNSPQVLAAQAMTKDSRLYQLSVKMSEKGFFRKLKKNYGINVVTTDRYQFDIYLDNKVIHHSNSVNDVMNFFAKDKRMQDRLMFVMDAEHIYNYGKRITFAENGMSQYQTSQLFIPGADTAKTDDEAVEVKKTAIDTVNNPFFTQADTALKCSDDCGEWVPTTVHGDQGTVTSEISDKTGFLPKNTLYSVMNTRVTKDDRVTDEQILQWFNYIRELSKAARGESPTFDQGILDTRKQQTGRLWFNWQTQVDQLKAGKLTTKSGNTLFKSLANIGGSKAFHKLNGLQGGNGFREYEKINENKGNVAAVIYNKWREQNGEDAVYVERLANLNNSWLGFLIPDSLLTRLFHDNDGVHKALVSAFRLGSEAMIPKCDSAKAGEAYFNCLYAGAQTSFRDVGIKDLGTDGKIKKEDYQKVLAYAGEVDQTIAAQQPLNERLFSLESRSGFARTVLMNAVVPVQTSGSFVEAQSTVASMIGNLPSIFGSAFSPNSSADIDEDTSLNNIDPAGIRVETLQHTTLSQTLNQSTGSADSCPGTEGENMCKADETVYLAFAAKYGLLPQDSTPGTNPGTDFVLGSYNQKASWTDVHDDAVNLIADKMDVVGTQETAGGKYATYRRLLSQKGFGAYPDWPRSSGYPRQCSSGRAIFYKQEKFHLDKAEVFSYPSYSDPAVTCGGGETTEQGRFNTPVVWLTDQNTGQQIVVMNTHNIAFCCGGGGERSAVKRYNAAKIYVAKIKEIEAASPGIPIFLTGDFNESHAVRYDRNTTYERKHDNLLFCMLKAEQLMNTVFEPDNPCQGDHESDAGGVDSIYATPGVQVDWKQELAAGHNGPSFSDHPVKFAHLVVPASGGSGEGVRIATFNILHVGTDPDERQWRTRMPKSIQTLKDNKITVAGLQEVRPEQHHLLNTESYVTDTYDNWPKDENGSGFTPNPIIWNKTVFSMVAGSGKRLSIEYDNGHKVDHAVQITLQEIADPSHQFYVLNTHDPANARPGSDQANALSRLHNTQFYTSYLANLSHQGKPIMFTGDFNAAYTMAGNQNPYNNDADNLAYCVISRGGVMKNVWDIFQHKAFHCPRENAPGGSPIDHIYVTGIDGVDRVWSVPDEYGHGSGGHNGSDHPTVMASVKMPWTQDNNGGGQGSWSLPLARSGWESDGQRWLEPHTSSSSAWTNDITAAADLNIGSGDSDCGKPVYSMLSGTVVSGPPTYTMQVRSMINGKPVLITYAHGNNMKQGGTIQAGDQIMVIGKNANPAYHVTCHLHLEISYNGRPVCPQDVLPLVARHQSVDLASLANRARPYCR